MTFKSSRGRPREFTTVGTERQRTGQKNRLYMCKRGRTSLGWTTRLSRIRCGTKDSRTERGEAKNYWRPGAKGDATEPSRDWHITGRVGAKDAVAAGGMRMAGTVGVGLKSMGEIWAWRMDDGVRWPEKVSRAGVRLRQRRRCCAVQSVRRLADRQRGIRAETDGPVCRIAGCESAWAALCRSSSRADKVRRPDRAMGVPQVQQR